jgi:hypothetical protein
MYCDVCCQVEVSATDRSVVHWNPADCAHVYVCMCLGVMVKPGQYGGLGPKVCVAQWKKNRCDRPTRQ